MRSGLDLNSTGAVHVIGCGGTGMAPITAVLAHLGLSVSGSDQRPSTTLDSLGALGVSVTVGDDYDSIDPEAAIVRSTAVPDTHPEVTAARADGRSVLRRAEVLSAITAAHRTVSIAGTHGKTTTASMTAAALLGAGVPVTSIVGGKLLGLEQAVPGAVLGTPGGVLVVEADESDGTFVELATDIAVVTNIEPDHLEYYGGEAGLYAAFDRFLVGKEQAVVCVDDPGVSAALARTGLDTAYGYGEDETASLALTFDPPASAVRVATESESRPISPRLPGRHNALNYTAALSVVEALGLDLSPAIEALDRFQGVGRRFERRGSRGGVEVVDDYAHLNGEIVAAILAARQVCDGNVHVAFQPHRFSRTEALWQTYASALATADSIVLTDIYSSGEHPRPGIDTDLIYNDLSRTAPGLPVQRVGPPAEVPGALAAVAEDGDLCLLLSAGDLPTIVPDLLDLLGERS